jgi:predicted ATPase
MFSRIYADNYGCLSNFTLTVNSLSVLLGPNGSGKSTLLRLVAAIRDFILGRSNSLDLFPAETLTRWDKRIEQTFELVVRLDYGEYTYRLKIRHEAPERGLNKVVEESLSLEGQPLFDSDVDQIHLYNDRHERKAQLQSDWHISGISRIHERPDNQKLIAFRRAIESTLVLALDPGRVSAVSSEKVPVTLPQPDCSDFSGWLRNISTTEGLATREAERNLSEGGLPGFRAFQLRPSGDAQIVECVFQSGRSKLTFRLDELSSGQIALVILETALAVAQEKRGPLLLDEPSNFLGLSEIQPLLIRLQDAALEGSFQVILTAHHPLAVDFLAGQYGSWLERESSGPTRVQPIRVMDSVLADDTGVRVSDLIARGWLSGLRIDPLKTPPGDGENSAEPSKSKPTP